MIKAVLFDLDDTLVEINLSVFVARYLSGMARLLGSVSRKGSIVAGAAIAHAYLQVNSQKRTDALSNRQLLDAELSSVLRIPMDDASIRDVIDCYEKTRLDGMADGLVMARPRVGAREALEACRQLGLKVALATNPAFSLAVDQVRLRWAKLDDFAFDAISTIDNSYRLKPAARYYRDFARLLDLMPEECLMVGNDASLDFPRPDIGISTCYVGHGRPSRPAAWTGPISDLADAIPSVIERINAQEDRADEAPRA